jgi:hypothetical protein
MDYPYNAGRSTMDSCPECGINYDMEFDYEETFEHRWVPRCDCFEDEKLLYDHIWDNSE